MTALRIVSIGVGYILGIALAAWGGFPVSALLLTTLAAVGIASSVHLFLRERRWQPWPPAAIALAACLCTLPVGYWRTSRMLSPPPEGSLSSILQQQARGEALAFRGTICKEPDLRGATQADLRVRIDSVRTGDDEDWTTVRPGEVFVRVYLVLKSGPAAIERFNRLTDPRAYGYRIEGETTLRPDRPTRNPGEFDYMLFLRQRDALARFRCYAGRVEILRESRGHLLAETALAAKRRFLLTFKATIRGPASRLAAAATLGTRRAVENVTFRDREIVKSFRHAGVGHVLAVSGLHVSVVSLLLYGLFRLAGLRPRGFTPFLIAFLVLFALLTGARPSSVRAVIMNSVVLIAHAYFRYDLRHAAYVGLAISALLILLVNPLILYTPGFLLSYGAVLSLVLVAPPLDRLLCLLRGFSLFFVLLWLALVILLCGNNLRLLLNARHWLALAGALWLGIAAGSALNSRFSRFWGIGLDRIPRALRFLLSAQLAIQVGMMIPLSAWFFGRFPVAGVLVNIVAIPAVGVLVQLGMLTGLVGLIPGVGHVLAAPFGAATTLVGQFFLWLAHAGSSAFPFPATPKPTAGWMVIYYGTLGAALFAVSLRYRVQGFLYAWWPKLSGRRWLTGLAFAAPLVLIVLPIAIGYPSPERLDRLVCLAAGRYPVVLAVSGRRTAWLVNGADAFTGKRVLFDAVREYGASEVDTAVACGPEPRAGMEGLASLAGLMRIRRCYMPAVVADPDDYLDALGDDYLVRKARQGNKWATRHQEAYVQLVAALAGARGAARALEPGVVADWDDARLRVLPRPKQLPERFVSSAKTALLEMEVKGFRWLVVTDSHSDVLRQVIPAGAPAYDVLVLPDLGSRRSYEWLIDAAVEQARPTAVIVSGSSPVKGFDIDAWAGRHGIGRLLMTGRDGAAEVTFPDADTMVIRGFLSGKTITVRQR